jgi:hypothetical protein
MTRTTSGSCIWAVSRFCSGAIYETVSGHFGIGLTAVEPEAREKVREILKAHGGHFVNFYGQWAAEALEP